MALRAGSCPCRRPHHQIPRGSAPRRETCWVAQELDEFADVFLGFVPPGHVGERRLDLVFRQEAGLALGEGHGSAAPTRATLHLAHEQHEHRDDDENGEARDQQLPPDARFLFFLPGDRHAVVVEVVSQLRIGHRRADHHEFLARLARTEDAGALHDHGVDVVHAHVFQEIRIADLRGIRLDVEVLEDRQQHGRDDQPKKEVFSHVIQKLTLNVRVRRNGSFYSISRGGIDFAGAIPGGPGLRQSHRRSGRACCSQRASSPSPGRPSRRPGRRASATVPQDRACIPPIHATRPGHEPCTTHIGGQSTIQHRTVGGAPRGLPLPKCGACTGASRGLRNGPGPPREPWQVARGHTQRRGGSVAQGTPSNPPEPRRVRARPCPGP